jgi:hypothetical protein
MSLGVALSGSLPQVAPELLVAAGPGFIGPDLD